MHHRASLALAAVALTAVALAACSAAPESTAPTGAASTGTASAGSTITVTSPPATVVISEQPSTVVTTPSEPTLVPPPPTTAEPRPASGDCPYLSTLEVRDANGQNVGRTATIAVDPYPICLFYRPDGTVLAAIRIIAADTPAEAAAAVNQHVPIADSFEVTQPAGWAGGAMATPRGVDGYPDARSIYAVSKGTIAVIAISNQAQSIKGRQMATDVIANLGL